jgi:hypothetical protein
MKGPTSSISHFYLIFFLLKMRSYQDEITNRFAIVFTTSLLFVGAILVVYFSIENKSNYVHHQSCNKPLGEFALEPGTASTSILKICGSSGNEVCSKKVNNLTEAVNYCNLNSKICDRFMYNSKTGTVSIVGLKTTLTENNDQDIYTRQLGITYEGEGDNKKVDYTDLVYSDNSDTLATSSVTSNNLTTSFAN